MYVYGSPFALNQLIFEAVFLRFPNCGTVECKVRKTYSLLFLNNTNSFVIIAELISNTPQYRTTVY